MSPVLFSLINLAVGIWLIFRVADRWYSPYYVTWWKVVDVILIGANLGWFAYQVAKWLI